LITVGIFSLFTGAVAVLLGVRILDMNLTRAPLVAAAGYVLTGATAILTLPAIALPKLKWLRWLTALAAIGSAIIWAITGFTSYWAHMDSFKQWTPK
jgi:putative membrane protein